MGKKFIVTEEEKKHIKGLYEQPESTTKEFEIDHAGIPVNDFLVTVNEKGKYDDGSHVKIQIDADGVMTISKIYNYSVEVSDEDIANYINGLIQNQYFSTKIPNYIAVDLDNQSLDWDFAISHK